MNTEKMPYLEAIVFQARCRCDERKDEMPGAAPLDLLTKQQQVEMEAFLERNYGVLRELIDENYVALLIALRQYEDISDKELRAMVTAHLVHNIKES